MKNQKIIYAGITILLMLTGVFIGFISNDVILQEEDPNSMIEPLTGLTSQAQQVFPKTDPDQLTSQASSQTSIPEIPINTWQEGETVRVDYVPRNNTVKESREDLVNYFGFECEFGGINTPCDITTDFPYLYVADSGAHRILKFTKSGEFVLEWGSFGLGDGEFKDPSGIAVDNDYVYVADKTNDRIQKFDKFGTFIAKWGTGGVGDGEFDLPFHLTVDDEYVYVTDLSNNRVQKFTKAGAFVAKWGSLGSGDGEFNNPHGIAVDDEYVYVADMYNDRVQKFTKAGTFNLKWGSSGSGDGEFNDPDGIAVDNDYVYVVDKTNDRVQQFLKDGTFHSKWGSFGLGDGEFYTPTGITVDDDRVYVSDYFNDDVQSFITSSDQIDISNPYDVFLADSAYAKYEFSPVNNPMFFSNVTLTYNMYDLAYPAEAGIKFKLDVIDDGILENAITDTSLTIAFDSSATYGSNELILYVHVGFSVDDGYVVKIVLFDTGTNEIKSSIEQQGSVTRISKLIFYLDHIWVESISITSNPRFNYYSTSTDSLLISLYLEMCDFRIPIKIYTDYELASINPNALTGRDSTNSFLWVNNTVPLTYTLLFNVVLPKQYLAIDDVSGYYLQDIGFEGSWQNNWIDETDPHGFDTIALNSSIVSEGSSSLRLQRYDGAGEMQYFHYTIDGSLYGGGLSGGCYFSFDYYIENRTGSGILSLSDTVTSKTFPSHEEDKWHSAFFYFNMKASSYVRIVGYIFSGIFFLDNFKIYQVNHRQETIDYSQNLFSGQLNSWTSKGLFPMPLEEINLELRDRTGDSSLKAIETMTDSQGFFYWNFQGKLLEKEYEFRSWSWDSWWGTPETMKEATESDLNDWSESGSFSTDAKEGSYSAMFEQSNFAINLDPDSNYDLEEIDYVHFWLKSNVSITTPQYFYLYCPDYPNRRSGDIYYNYGSLSANIWKEYQIKLEDLGTTGNPDLSDVGILRWYFLTVSTKYYFDAVRTIQAQKSFFTPLTTGSIDYAISEQENNPLDQTNYWGFDGWDFSEETLDGWSPGAGNSVIEAKDGYLRLNNTENSGDYSTLKIALNLDSSYYNTIAIRFKTNSSTCFLSTFRRWDWEGFGGGYMYADSEYKIYSRDIANAANWHDTAGLLFYFDDAEGEHYAQIWIDWIRLTHRDSDLEQGYSWEFNEDNYNDDWGEASSSTISTDNGYITIEQAAADTTYAIRNKIEGLNTGTAQYLYFKYKATDEVLGLNIARYDLGANYISLSAGWAMPATSTWSYHITDLSSDPDWDGDIHDDSLGLVFISDSGAENVLEISELRFLSNIPPNLYETQTDFLIDNEGFLDYITFTDNIFSGYYTNMDFIAKNLTIGSHSFVYSAFYDYLRPGVTLPSAFYQYDYDIDETGIMKIIIHDQSGNVIPFDSMEVYIDSTRLFDNYIYFLDISQTFNLTITDLFENMLYQDTTEDFENFKEIQLTLHSIKVQNLQENPIWLNIIRDSKTFSEWIYPYEIVKYRLEAATYDFKIYYCDSLAADLGAFSTNGSWVNFEYAVSSDSALMVTGETIQDVFDNVLSLTQDLDSVNTSMHIAFEDQSQNFTLQFTATNQNITFMLGNSSLIIDTINSNFTAILGDLILLDSNINGNFTSTFLSIAGNTTLLVNQLNSNFTNLNGLIISNNTVLYTQLVHTLADLAELKGLYRVHFSVIDGAGIGLPFETVLLNVNDSRQFDQDVYLSNNTYFEAEAFDWFDVSLWSDNFSITKRTEVNISIQLYWVLFENNGSYTSYLEIWRNNKLGVNITVAPDQTVSIRLTEGVYDYRVYYFKNDSQQTKQKDPSIYSYGRRLLSIGKFAVSALMPTKINVSTPKIKLPLLDAIMAELTLVEIIANVILTVLGLAASYFVLNFIVRRAIGRHAQDPSYVPPRDRDDWLDQLEKKAGLQTDDEGLW